MSFELSLPYPAQYLKYSQVVCSFIITFLHKGHSLCVEASCKDDVPP